MISERDALAAMRLFLEHVYEQTGNDMETHIADITMEADGSTLDPAAWEDWLRCVEKAKQSSA
jgi:hypothetical protein